ncbi:MAG TPA: MaoC family dehydratase N-terminal domain-containing protein, partial [Pseudonocardiaceae bacterium]|nr:MaoC family dehydratase N-terminal domain-containing protein [Pseudonocardiaceae bacterium]
NFSHHRPIIAGDQLILTTHIEGAMSRAGNDMLTVRTEIVDAGGEAVSTTTATLVFRGEA